MYEAKAGGKARCAEYAPAMGDRIREHAALGAELREALAREQLHVVYQPVVELPGGSPVGVEALVRWTHPTRGLISPAEFIPAAERTGLIVPLGMWVLRRALSECKAWIHAHPRARLAVNVAARQLQEPDFAEHVGRALSDAGVAPERLLLEVTESAVLAQLAALVNPVAGVCDGARTSIRLTAHHRGHARHTTGGDGDAGTPRRILPRPGTDPPQSADPGDRGCGRPWSDARAGGVGGSGPDRRDPY